jgi:3-oxoacyl-[acyl-carrier protein] reductase
MDLGLRGKVAMVAGASKGLGFAVAKELAAEGSRVSICSSNPAAIRSSGEQIAGETGAQVLAFEADVRSASALTAWRDATLKKFGAIDLLFANSGGPPAGTFSSFDDKAWTDAFEILVLSIVRMVRLVTPSMKERGSGSIVMSASSSVKEPSPNLTLSNVVRASVPALAKTLAVEFAPDRIRVNTAIPGRIDTDRVRHLDNVNAERLNISVPEYRQRVFAAIPAGRYGLPEEYARAVVFLLSEAAGFITGATLQVDGGMIRSVY